MKKTIITIGRQFGSGGRAIGKQIAEDLGYKFYDGEMLERAANISGIDKEVFKENDEKPNNSFLYSLGVDSHSFGFASNIYNELPMNHRVFLAQFDAIKKIAEEGPCVLIGRCADYALEDYDNVLKVFIYADLKSRVKRVLKTEDVNTEDKALVMIRKNDKRRASYYNYFSDKKWGLAESYDLCLNSDCLGIKGTAKLIERFAELSGDDTPKIFEL